MQLIDTYHSSRIHVAIAYKNKRYIIKFSYGSALEYVGELTSLRMWIQCNEYTRITR